VIGEQPSSGPKIAVGSGVARAADPAVRLVEARRALPILDVGCCEPFKAAIHGAAMGLTVLMGAYNAAAWLRRRQRHLAINAVIYLTAAIWEAHHVQEHVARCLPRVEPERTRTPAPRRADIEEAA
jgi:hypothetical protein